MDFHNNPQVSDGVRVQGFHCLMSNLQFMEVHVKLPIKVYDNF